LHTALSFGGNKTPAVHNKPGNDSDDEEDEDGDGDRVRLQAAPTTRTAASSNALSGQSSEPVTLEREARFLASPNVSECCGVLSRVTALLEDPHSSSDAVDSVLSALIRPIIAVLVHPAERCRDFAARTIIRALDRVSDAGDALPLCLPTLLKRLVVTKSDTPCEPSEEVRLLLLLILSKFMTLASSSAVAPYLSTIVTIITAVAADNHPEIRKESCHCVALLRRPSGGKLKPYSKQIFDAILPSLMHRLARVRLAAVTALGTLLLCGGAELILACIAWQEPNVIPIKDFFHDDNRAPRRNYFGMLASDTSPLVRDGFLQMLADCCTNMAERYDYEGRISPYVQRHQPSIGTRTAHWLICVIRYLLNGLLDPVPASAKGVFDLLEAIGHSYLKSKEREPEVKDFLEFGQTTEAERNDVERWAMLLPQFPHPVIQRPNLGARIFIRNQFRGLVGAITRELVEVHAPTRMKTLGLLRLLVLYCEEYQLTGQLHVVLDALAKCGGLIITSPGAPSESRDGLHLTGDVAFCCGAFVHPDAWLPVLSHLLHSQTTITPAPGMVAALTYLAAQLTRSCANPRLSAAAAAIAALVNVALQACNDAATACAILSLLYTLRSSLPLSSFLPPVFAVVSRAARALHSWMPTHETIDQADVSSPSFVAGATWQLALEGARSFLKWMSVLGMSVNIEAAAAAAAAAADANDLDESRFVMTLARFSQSVGGDVAVQALPPKNYRASLLQVARHISTPLDME
jgi:hypothetical protein